MNINRDYIINIALANPVNRGKITTNKQIYFYNTDKYTQNIYLVCDVDVRNLSFLLAFRNGEAHKVEGETINPSTVEFNIPYEYLQVIGKYEAQIVVTTEAERLNSEPFSFTVKSSITTNGGK